MLGLELVVVLAVALIACSVLARRLRIAPAVLLLVTGILLGLLPALHEVRLPPEVVLLLFLPALLFWESLTTSLQGIRRDLRGIILTSTVLVVLTAAAVAAVAHAFGVPWGVAWVLGAALAPTDATAVAAFARSMPRRNVTILKAESLINDGTALVIYGIAVGVTVGEQEVTALGITGEFLLSYLGGAAAGAVIAAAGLFVLRRLDDPILKNVALILIPFGSYLLAELVHASGVLAVVVAGLITTQVGPRVSSATSRRQSESFWSLATFILNGSLFVLVGLEVSTAVRSLPPAEIGIALVMAVVVWLVILAVRYAFLFGAVALIRLLDRRPSQRARRMGYRTRIVGGMAGFRGAVSLAAALAVPTTLSSGDAFPDRNLIIFVTAGVIVLTLVVQGVLLPPLVRWARFPADSGPEDERRLAETVASEEALAAIPEVAEELDVDADIRERVTREVEEHLAVLRAEPGDSDDDGVTLAHSDQYRAIRLALIARKRVAVLALRDEQRIDDTVLRRVQALLDVEEVRLRGQRPRSEPASRAWCSTR